MESRQTKGDVIEAAYQAALAAGGRPLMPPRGTPKKPKSRWPDAIALIFVGVVMAFVLYPVWEVSHRDHRTRGVVQDENRRPIAGATLHIRDAFGRDLGDPTTDTNGEVIWKHEWEGRGITFGDYGPVRYSHNTGGCGRVFLNPLAQHHARVINALSGLHQGGVLLSVIPSLDTLSYPDRHEFTGETGANGEINLGAFPSSARMEFRSQDKRFVVCNVSHHSSTDYCSTPARTVVRYKVTVTPTGSITGRIVLPDGRPAPEGTVYIAPLRGGADDTDRRTEWGRYSDAKGAFRFPDLAPGRYRLHYQPGNAYDAFASEEREVRVQSGQTTLVAPPLLARKAVTMR